MKRQLSALVCVALLLGCSPSLVGRVDQARQQWDRQGITDYRIEIEFYENFINQLETRREVVVRDGEVVESSCEMDSCPLFILAGVYTVDDLFAIAQGEHLSSWTRGPVEECIMELEFDATFGFPRVISIDCPNAYDEDHRVRVLSFEALE